MERNHIREPEKGRLFGLQVEPKSGQEGIVVDTALELQHPASLGLSWSPQAIKLEPSPLTSVSHPTT